MTRRDRVLQAIQHQETDLVPYHVGLTQQARERLTRYTGDPEYIDRIGNHLSLVYYDGYLQERPDRSGYWQDHFGVLWNRNGADKDIGAIEGAVLQTPSLHGYHFPVLDQARLRAEYATAAAHAQDRCLLGAIGFSLFERAWTLRGMENLLVEMVTEPAFVHELLDAICEHDLRIVDIALEYPIDGFHFGDDWGQQRGLIMGPRHWRTFIKPRLARLYERVKRAGKFVSQHSCGDIQQLFPDLIELGLDVYQTFQPEIYDIGRVKREYGASLTFWGGISTQRVLPWCSPAEVRSITRETMRTMAVGGGYIAAPTHDIPGDVPAENIVALVEELQHQSAA
jgi:uroporphyrinogen decarboxylase